MPNGGSDCCGTCWFNRTNHGRAGYVGQDPSIPPFCEIRDVAIEDPFYTYCANHPHRRPERDPIPIGPILRPGEVTLETPEIAPTVLNTGTHWPTRVVWKRSPDTEQIRSHLLALLGNLEGEAARDGYLATPGMAHAVIWQLGEFREHRAVPGLVRLIRGGRDPIAREALAKIQQATPGAQVRMEAKQPNHARQLLLDTLDWLRTTYVSHRFFLQRDVAWTVQKHLLDRIGRLAPEYRVVHNFTIRKPGPRFDLVVLGPNETAEIVLKFKFEPARKLAPGKVPVVDWAYVVSDVAAVQRAAEEHHAKNACSLFIDESGGFRKRHAPAGSRWEEWDVGNGVRIAVLISEGPRFSTPQSARCVRTRGV